MQKIQKISKPPVQLNRTSREIRTHVTSDGQAEQQRQKKAPKQNSVARIVQALKSVGPK